MRHFIICVLHICFLLLGIATCLLLMADTVLSIDSKLERKVMTNRLNSCIDCEKGLDAEKVDGEDVEYAVITERAEEETEKTTLNVNNGDSINLKIKIM